MSDPTRDVVLVCTGDDHDLSERLGAAVWRGIVPVVFLRSDDVAGHLVADGDGFAITTADGRLRLGRVRIAGRKPMTAAELRRGAPGLVGSVVR